MTAQTIRWRVSLVGRVGGFLCGGVIFGLGAFLAASGARTSDRIAGLVFLTVAPLAWWIFSLRPYVELSADWLTVQNPLRHRDVRLTDVADVFGGYTGLRVSCRDGTTLNAWAVQTSNFSQFLRRRTRADEVADAIRASKRKTTT